MLIVPAAAARARIPGSLGSNPAVGPMTCATPRAMSPVFRTADELVWSYVPVAEMSGFQASYARSIPTRAIAALARTAATSGPCLAVSWSASRKGTGRRSDTEATGWARAAVDPRTSNANAFHEVVDSGIASTADCKRHAVLDARKPERSARTRTIPGHRGC